MPSFIVPQNGDDAVAEHVAQIVEDFQGLRNIPIALSGINDAAAYALTLKNVGVGSKGLIIYAADGTTVLLQVDGNGVQASTAGGAAAPLSFTPGAGSITNAMLAGSIASTKLALTTASNVLGADVNLNSTGTYFDGPSMAQGTAGIWLVTGTVTLTDTAAAAFFVAKLWDGTTVIASSAVSHTAVSGVATITLTGILTTPAANIRISVKDTSATTGKILANVSGGAKDSSIFGIRIG